MYLYSLVGADAHKDPEYGLFTPDGSGAFPFPDEVSDVLVTCAVRGRKQWETEEARAERMHGQEMARRRDPASVLTAMEENAALVRQLAAVTAQLAAIQLAQAAPAAPVAAPVPEAAAEDPEPAVAAAEVPAVPEAPAPAGGDSEAAALVKPAPARKAPAAKTTKAATQAA